MKILQNYKWTEKNKGYICTSVGDQGICFNNQSSHNFEKPNLSSDGQKSLGNVVSRKLFSVLIASSSLPSINFKLPKAVLNYFMRLENNLLSLSVKKTHYKSICWIIFLGVIKEFLRQFLIYNLSYLIWPYSPEHTPTLLLNDVSFKALSPSPMTTPFYISHSLNCLVMLYYTVFILQMSNGPGSLIYSLLYFTLVGIQYDFFVSCSILTS